MGSRENESLKHKKLLKDNSRNSLNVREFLPLTPEPIDGPEAKDQIGASLQGPCLLKSWEPDEGPFPLVKSEGCVNEHKELM